MVCYDVLVLMYLVFRVCAFVNCTQCILFLILASFDVF